MSYSPVISYMMDRIAGFSTNSYKLQVLGSSSAGPNQIVRFELPSNAIVDLRKLAFAFRCTVTGTDAARLSDANNVIERVSVTVGGTELSSGFGKYNVLHNIKKALLAEDRDMLTEHPEITREKSLQTGVAFVNDGGEPSAEYRIDNWLSFIGECEPRNIDTSKFATIQISITLSAAAAVVVQGGAAANVSTFITAAATDGDYALTDMYATIPILTFADGLYDGMVNAIMQKQGFLELPYKNYTNHSDVGSKCRWHASSASVDRIWTCTRDLNYNTVRVPKLVVGYDGAVAANGFGNVLKFVREKYVSNFMNFPAPASAGGITSQHNINSSLLPQYLMTPLDEALLTKQSVPRKYQTEHALKTMTSNFNCSCIRLNLEDSERLRIASGLDARGVSLNGIYQLYGLDGGETPIDLFVESTSVLRVGTNMQIEVVA
jgi:hypothetical protein